MVIGSAARRSGFGCLARVTFVALAVGLGLNRPLVALHLVLSPPPHQLAVPVAGVSARALADSWGAPRGGGRLHEGIDIFAPRGTPVLANTRGLVLATGQNRLGGNTVTVLGPGPQAHYFAHLDRFGDFRRGDVVHPGDVLGYVGTTGNARGTPPHLHYGIYVVPGYAVNPFPILTRLRPAA